MSTDDKKAFAERLKTALKRSTKPISTAADLALQFNLRHPHEPITPQAAQKWLKGTARPKPEKIATLAEWLNVSPHWLQYGSPGARRTSVLNHQHPVSLESLTEDERAFVERFRCLTQHQRVLVAELVEELADISKIWPSIESDK